MSEELSYKEYLSKHESRFDVCVMLLLDAPKWDDLKARFEEEDLVKGISYCPTGFETEPHITLHYGFRSDTEKDQLKSWLVEWFEHFDSLEFNTKVIDLFENEDYDVVKFNMEHMRSLLLPPLKALKSEIDYVDNYPNYNPHMTIAYVNSGTGNKYTDDLVAPMKIRFKGIKVSGGNIGEYVVLNSKDD